MLCYFTLIFTSPFWKVISRIVYTFSPLYILLTIRRRRKVLFVRSILDKNISTSLAGVSIVLVWEVSMVLGRGGPLLDCYPSPLVWSTSALHLSSQMPLSQRTSGPAATHHEYHNNQHAYWYDDSNYQANTWTRKRMRQFQHMLPTVPLLI